MRHQIIFDWNPIVPGRQASKKANVIVLIHFDLCNVIWLLLLIVANICWERGGGVAVSSPEINTTIWLLFTRQGMFNGNIS